MLLLALPAAAADFDFTCADGGPVVGLPGLVVNCVAEVPVGGTFDDVSWRFGDGGVATGTAVSHTYEDVGQFSVVAEVTGWVPDDPADVETPTAEQFGLVTVCGAPEPEFEWVGGGGLDVALINHTEPQYRCISEVRWEVFEGSSQGGEALMTFDTWHPEITLPEEGLYTVVLTMGGIGGTGAASLEIDARYGLPQELTDGPLPFAACDTGLVGGSAGWAWAPLALLALGRRRR